jgi:predicted amidohydrolase YtcJ
MLEAMASMNSTLILSNGRILTMDPDHPFATALAIRDGQILSIGSDAQVRAAVPQTTQTIDLQGRTATPGLIDAHAHPMGVGFARADLNIASPPCHAIEDIVRLVVERAAATTEGSWVVGRGYDQGRLTDRRHPTRWDLDPLSAGHPVLLLRACHHIGVANTYALRLAGIDRNSPDPPGGAIDRDEHGEPTGVVRESALGLVHEAKGEPGEEDIQRAIELGGRAFLEAGVTSVGEALIDRHEQWRAYQRTWSGGTLPARTYLMLEIDFALEALRHLGLSTGFGDRRLRIGPAKLFVDGSIGGHTARMRHPYNLTSNSLGLWMADPDVMKRRLIEAHEAGMQVTAHAIGDAAIDLVLDAYEEAHRIHPRRGTRHRIEHCSIVDEETIERIARLGVVPIPGTSFLHDFRASYVANLGMDRIRYAYGMATLQRYGIRAAASSDAPIVSESPLIGIQTMMTRTDRMGEPVWPEEAIDLRGALAAYTANGAYASFEEGAKGMLRPGMLGDVTVFEANLDQISHCDIGSVKIDYTIIDGQIAFARGGTQG